MSKDIPNKNFYWGHGYQETWEKFKEICRREGSTVSEKLREFVFDYVRVHEPGNPQLRLDVIMQDGGPKDPACSECGDPAERRYRTRKGPVLRCRRHRLGAGDPLGVLGWEEV